MVPGTVDVAIDRAPDSKWKRVKPDGLVVDRRDRKLRIFEMKLPERTDAGAIAQAASAVQLVAQSSDARTRLVEKLVAGIDKLDDDDPDRVLVEELIPQVDTSSEDVPPEDLPIGVLVADGWGERTALAARVLSAWQREERWRRIEYAYITAWETADGGRYALTMFEGVAAYSAPIERRSYEWARAARDSNPFKIKKGDFEFPLRWSREDGLHYAFDASGRTIDPVAFGFLSDGTRFAARAWRCKSGDFLVAT